MMSALSDKIEITLPFKSDYVSVARLTVSGIANRMGFDIETIEDIKVAVAEVCNKLVNTGKRSSGYYKITFGINNEKLVITFDSPDKALKCIFNDNGDELGLSIINAFMDNVEFCPDNSYILSMTKAFEGTFGDGK
jgi:serine/threonine-protein kinase RsbW